MRSVENQFVRGELSHAARQMLSKAAFLAKLFQIEGETPLIEQIKAGFAVIAAETPSIRLKTKRKAAFRKNKGKNSRYLSAATAPNRNNGSFSLYSDETLSEALS